MESSDQHGKKNVGLISDPHSEPTTEVRPDRSIFSPGDVICERYSVIRFIARGGMGEVYEVEDWELQARIALKTIAPERASSARQIGRFRQEIQLARKVSHPNVCRVFDLGHHKDRLRADLLFLTMELLEGETLFAYLQHHGPMTREQALPLVRQMVSALAAAHQLGIVHRDFKPGNVMLLETTRGPLAKVTDFGLATNPECDETLAESVVDVVGTPEYMAPEQLRGQCSSRTDIYALGLTVFQMLTGRLPCSHDAPFNGLEADVVKRIGPRWRDAITKSLTVNPAARFATVDEFWCALSGENLPRQSGWKAFAAGIRRHGVIYGVAAGLLVAVLALVMAGVMPNPFKRLPQEKHLAVLPFQNIGNDASNQAFAEGVAESLTSKLSQLERYQKSFWVVPSSDTRNVKSLDEAYRNLNVTLAVTGSIEHTPEGLNLTADLVDPKNHRQLSSRSIHVASANLDEMQQRVWESVADMLDLQVNSQIKEELAAGGTTQPGAYELYEEGVGYLKRFNLDDVDRAIGLFNAALSKDPSYTLAYSGLGNAFADKFVLTKDPQWIDLATYNANRALELNDRLIEVHMTLGRVYQQTGQFDKAIPEYKRVLDQDPAIVEAEFQLAEVYEAKQKYEDAEDSDQQVIARRPGYWLGYSGLGTLYYREGKFSSAVQQFKTMIDLAPDNSLGYYDLGGAYMGLGHYEDAVAVLKRGLSIREDSVAWSNLGAAYMYLGKYAEAADATKKATDLSPHNHDLWRNLADSYHQIPGRQLEATHAYQKALETALAQLKVNANNPQVLSSIALYYAHLGEKSNAERYISGALDISPKDSYSLFTSALVYEIIGHRERALQAVSDAVQAGYSLAEVEQEPELRALRSDSRYQRWLSERDVRAPHSKS
ncbi:MAG: protein kinase domain-containing protein [Candidatus Korobacteraceae bacterium]|jgi:serine/threonine protein kinase/Flp pilus assembly protein TadD